MPNGHAKQLENEVQLLYVVRLSLEVTRLGMSHSKDIGSGHVGQVR